MPIAAMLLFLLFYAATALSDNMPLYAIVSETNTPPYAIFNADHKLQSGLSKDIIDELGRRVNRTVEYINLPRARVEPWLIEGQAEIACFLNPDWVNEPDKLLWSTELFSTRQLLVRRSDSAPISAIQHLAGKRVGTTRGFTYPELEQVFQSGDVIRDDAHSLQSNLLRLKQGRLDVVMTVDLSYHFFVKTLDDQSFSADPLWSKAPSVYCGLSQHNPKNALLLRETLQAITASGFIEQRLAFYKGQ